VAVLKCHCSHAPSLNQSAAQLQKKKEKKREQSECLQKSAFESHQWLTFHPCKYSQEGKPVTRTHPKKEKIIKTKDMKNDEIKSQINSDQVRRQDSRTKNQEWINDSVKAAA
jgi:hypothetical protein